MLIQNAMLVDALGARQGDVLIENGKIIAIGQQLEAPSAQAIDANGLTLMPAFIDLHCHFRTPGFEYKETIESGSRAAARGGYTVVTCMANTNPVCSSAAIAQSVMDEASRIGLCEVQQCISITKDFDGKTVSHLKTLPRNLRFISDDGKGVQSNYTMWHAMQIAAQKGLTVLSHAEDMDISPEDYRLAENIETARNIFLSEATGARLHMCHVSTKEALYDILAAKERGAKVSLEVSPHHIYFHDTDFRVNPPIRAKDDVLALIEAMGQGSVDAIATDHAPHSPEDKANGAPGMVGLETAFAVCNTVLCQQHSLPLSRLSAMMSRGPADILGLNKGLLQEGFDADLVLVQPEAAFVVDAEKFAGKSHNTPYDGHTLHGVIHMTLKAGEITYYAQGAGTITG